MVPHIEMSCPSCRRGLRIRADYTGQRVRCRFCRSDFEVSATDYTPSEPPPFQPHGSWPAFGDGLLKDGPAAAARPPGPNPGPEPDPPAAFAIPGYEILGIIRDGSMGRVYKAVQTRLDREVAIKVLHEALCNDPEYQRRFRREAEVAARLSHSNFVRVIDAGESAGRPYIVMEFIEGETVQDRLDSGRPFGGRAAATIGVAVAEALAHADRRGLIHRDVKPANVLLADTGTVKLLDLGLARPVDDPAWASAEAGNAIGTPEYISPEQVRGLVDLDIRGDIYGLGATLYHMVTGRAPYSGTTAEILTRHVNSRSRPVPPDRLKPDLVAGLSAVILKMMAKDREGRYPGPADLIADLNRVLRGERPVAAGPDPPHVPTEGR